MDKGVQVLPLVMQDLKERDRKGKAEYGKSLSTATDVDLLQYAYEEALDLAMYLRAEIERRNHDA